MTIFDQEQEACDLFGLKKHVLASWAIVILLGYRPWVAHICGSNSPTFIFFCSSFDLRTHKILPVLLISRIFLVSTDHRLMYKIKLRHRQIRYREAYLNSYFFNS